MLVAVLGLAWALSRNFSPARHRLVQAALLLVLAVMVLLFLFGEMLPIPLDDNLGITLAAGYAMKLLAN